MENTMEEQQAQTDPLYHSLAENVDRIRAAAERIEPWAADEKNNHGGWAARINAVAEWLEWATADVAPDVSGPFGEWQARVDAAEREIEKWFPHPADPRITYTDGAKVICNEAPK